MVFELARGFFRNLLLLYNKSIEYDRFSDLSAFAGRLQRYKPYYAGTIIGAFESHFRHASMADFLQYSNLSFDEAQMIFFRSELKKVIRRGWAKLMSKIDIFVNSVRCREDIPAPRLEGDLYVQDLKLKLKLCGKLTNCGLKAYVSKNEKAFTELRHALLTLKEPDTETVRRIKSLRELYRVSNKDFDARDCFNCGDAIIAHETPQNSVIISKNERHLSAICKSFNKNPRFHEI